MKDYSWFKQICALNGLDIAESKSETLKNYVDLLTRWNSKVNLISRKSEDKIWCNQILPSVSFLFKFKFPGGASIADIGTGGGLPGMPVAILQPDLRLLLVDSTEKKIRILQNMVEELSLPNVKIMSGRAEEIAKRKEIHHKFDYVMARGVGPAGRIVGWCGGFLSSSEGDEKSKIENGKEVFPRGSILLLKGGNVDEETGSLKSDYPKIRVRTDPIEIKGIMENELFDKKIIIIQMSGQYGKQKAF